MHPCLEISMDSWPAHCTQIHLVIFSILIHPFVLATKPNLVKHFYYLNHALFETYFQDEDSQMDTQPKLEGPW